MRNTLRFGTALSAIAIASVLGGCATSQTGPRETIFGDKFDKSNVALATRAAAALAAEDYGKAVDLAERAVDKSPRDAGFRALLGNAYFGSGRFASAEAAYRDALSLLSNQPQVVLKLALVQIAQGKTGDAIAFLEAGRAVLDASDYGLALALAGDPARAVAELDAAARQTGADARLRQNLALAHGLAGNWAVARTVAEQDLAPDQVDARIQQWMTFAKPARASDQVAALTGVTPAASDPGQPVRLALRDAPTQQAAVQAPLPPAPPVRAVGSVPSFEESPPAFAAAEPAPAIPAPAAPVAAAEPVVAAEYTPPPPPMPPARPVVRAAAFVPAKKALRNASLPRAQGRSTAVVQLGAYGSPERVAAAWTAAARRYTALRPYAPMSARFSSANGTVYRLSVKGFASQREALGLCASLKRSGSSCFVRSVAGDAPVRIAAR